MNLVSLFSSTKYNKRNDEYGEVMKIEQDLF